MTLTTWLTDKADAALLGFRARAAGLTVERREIERYSTWLPEVTQAVTLTGDPAVIDRVTATLDPRLSDSWWNSGRTSEGPRTGRLSWVR